MKQTTFSKSVLQAVFVIIVTIFFALSGLTALTRYDNKYISKAALTQEHLAVIPEKGYCSLADGWELYPDRLLSPDDFSSGTPPHYDTWAGEYPNLSAFHEDRNPYGTATWRLRLQGSGMVTLYLQEPLCAARVFVNGTCLGGPGNVSQENYAPLIRDTFYSFLLEGETELIIQTANYSHYYGGLWYVPVIGRPDSISHLIAFRMVLYGMLFFPAIALSLFCIALWKRQKNTSDTVVFFFGLLSLSFALRICYPFFRLAGLPDVRFLYAVEDASALAGIFFSIRIVIRLFLPEGFTRFKTMLYALSLGMCGLVVFVPLFLFPAFPTLILLYGPFLSWYKLIMSGLSISLTVYCALMGFPYRKTALAAVTANGICLLYGVLSIGYYEPFIGAFPEEYGVFCMVAAFAVLMVQRSLAMASENSRLRLHLQEEVQEKTEHLQKLLAERSQLIAELGHDMKSPLTSLSNMAQIIRLNDIMLDEDTHRRMLHIEEQCGILSERLKSIQEIASRAGSPLRMKPVLLNAFLSDFYHSCRPIIELYGPDFSAKITPRPCHVMADCEQLFRALENLLYNAADFTPPDGKITLSLSVKDSSACIIVSDTGCGISAEDLPNVFRRSYTTRGDRGGQGLGLAIARTVVLEHGGQIEVSSKKGEGTAFTLRLPLLS